VLGRFRYFSNVFGEKFNLKYNFDNVFLNVNLFTQTHQEVRKGRGVMGYGIFMANQITLSLLTS